MAHRYNHEADARKELQALSPNELLSEVRSGVESQSAGHRKHYRRVLSVARGRKMGQAGLNRFEKRETIEESHAEKNRERRQRRDTVMHPVEIPRDATVQRFFDLLGNAQASIGLHARLRDIVTPETPDNTHPAVLKAFLENTNLDAIGQDPLSKHLHGFRGVQRLVRWKDDRKKARKHGSAAPATNDGSAELAGQPLVVPDTATVVDFRNLLHRHLPCGTFADAFDRLGRKNLDLYNDLYYGQNMTSLCDCLRSHRIANIAVLGSLLQVPLKWQFQQSQEDAALGKEKRSGPLNIPPRTIVGTFQAMLARHLGPQAYRKACDDLFNHYPELYLDLLSSHSQYCGYQIERVLQKFGINLTDLGSRLNMQVAWENTSETRDATETATETLRVPRSITGCAFRDQVHVFCVRNPALEFKAYQGLYDRCKAHGRGLWGHLLCSDHPAPLLQRLSDFGLTEQEFITLLKPISVAFDGR